MNIRWLNALEASEYDPTGRGLIAIKTRFPESESYNAPSPLFKKTPEQIFEIYRERFHTDCPQKHKPILAYDRDHFSKWQPQGGHYSADRLLSKYEPFYEIPIVKDHPILDRGLKSFLKELSVVMRHYGRPQIKMQYFTKNTSAGLPTMGKKSSWLAHVSNPTFSWTHILPDLPNSRRMRGKDRLTHEDSTSNIDYVSPYIAGVRDWLRQYFPQYFSGWLNPHDHLYPKITEAMIRNWYSFEADYKALDEHFSLELVRKYVLPVYELLLTPSDFLHFAAAVEELFNQPVYLGDRIIEGLHNLFSGQAITQDFETIFDIILISGCALEALPLNKPFIIAAVGDDVIFLTAKQNYVETFGRLYKEACESVGLVISEEKTRIGHDSYHFLRTVYYRALPVLSNSYGQPMVIPAYPPVLALNNIIQPENHSPYPIESLLAKLQNTESFYRYRDFAYFVFSLIDKNLLREISQDGFDYVNRRDWWTALSLSYSLSPDSSAVRMYEEYLQSVVQSRKK